MQTPLVMKEVPMLTPLFTEVSMTLRKQNTIHARTLNTATIMVSVTDVFHTVNVTVEIFTNAVYLLPEVDHTLL